MDNLKQAPVTKGEHFVKRPTGTTVDNFFRANNAQVNQILAKDAGLPKDAELEVKQCTVGAASASPMTAYLLTDVRDKPNAKPHSVILIVKLRHRMPEGYKQYDLSFSVYREGREALEAGLDRAPLRILEDASETNDKGAMEWRRACVVNHFAAVPVASAKEFNALVTRTGQVLLVSDPRSSYAYTLDGTMLAISRADLAGSIAVTLQSATREEAKEFAPKDGSVVGATLTRASSAANRACYAVSDLKKLAGSAADLKDLAKDIAARFDGLDGASVAKMKKKIEDRHKNLLTTATKIVNKVIPIASVDQAAITLLERKVASAQAPEDMVSRYQAAPSLGA